MSPVRVCVIGAGPSGMNLLSRFDRLRKEGVEIPDVVCYEKAKDWGGMWNYSWRTGLDEFGETVHGSQYRYLWSNGPKEALEFPDYTFEDHFGRAIPSYPPREVLFDYLTGYWRRGNLRPWIRFTHAVKSVSYNETSDDFSVTVKNLPEDRVLAPERFDYVVVASGHYSVPHVPSFDGIDKFEGRVLHAHDFREANEFKGKRLLLIGASYSAEDIAMQCLKYGAADIICTWRTKPMGFLWPKEISERPLLQKIAGKTCHFKDGSTADVDAILLCTGYQHAYPFVDDNLRLRSANVLYSPGLYKGLIWTGAGNNKLIYHAPQDNFYTFTMFDVESKWIVDYIRGKIGLPEKRVMDADWKAWVARLKACKDVHEQIDFQTAYCQDLAKDCEYGYDPDIGYMLHEWEGHKHREILTYRDQSYASKWTGTQSPVHKYTFMEALDDSMATFLAAGEKTGGSE